jgi:hypothetical protein
MGETAGPWIGGFQSDNRREHAKDRREETLVGFRPRVEHVPNVGILCP